MDSSKNLRNYLVKDLDLDWELLAFMIFPLSFS